METELLSCDEYSINKAAQYLKNGEVVGMPTETVYGLAANAFDEIAVAKIFKAKGRPADNPLIVHISQTDQLEKLSPAVPQLAYKCGEKFWPGPLTMIVPKSDSIPLITSGGLDTVGIRMPSHKTARKLIDTCGFPLAAPSANLSGSPSPTSAKHVYNDMNGKIPAIIDGGNCGVGVESTVIAFEGENTIRLLRPGFISVEDLKEITPDVIVDEAITHKLKEGSVVRSPGMKYKHYAPKADITIIDGSAEDFREFVKDRQEDFLCMVFTDEDMQGIDKPFIKYGADDEQQAKNLFGTLRYLDEIGAKKVYARCPDKNGVGLAVYNRLLRAAGFQVIKL